MAIKGPLTRIRILDLTVAHAGPAGAKLLGDLAPRCLRLSRQSTET
jgi:crotonobetainyl-CoA:carnitine CoA-transferase CaiB-like acyl-CoA transferase